MRPGIKKECHAQGGFPERQQIKKIVMLGAASKGYRWASSFEVFQADSSLRLGGSKCPFRALAPEKYTNTKIPRSLPFEVTQGMKNIFYRGSWPTPTKKCRHARGGFLERQLKMRSISVKCEAFL